MRGSSGKSRNASLMRLLFYRVQPKFHRNYSRHRSLNDGCKIKLDLTVLHIRLNMSCTKCTACCCFTGVLDSFLHVATRAMLWSKLTCVRIVRHLIYQWLFVSTPNLPRLSDCIASFKYTQSDILVLNWLNTCRVCSYGPVSIKPI